MHNRDSLTSRREYEYIVHEGGYQVIISTPHATVVLAGHEDACFLAKNHMVLEDMENAIILLFPEHREYLLAHAQMREMANL